MPGFIKYVNNPVIILNINKKIIINLNIIFFPAKISITNINNEKINIHKNVDKKALS